MEITDLRVEYPSRDLRQGPKLAVNGLNLSVSSGEVFGFLGPNGAGKTTTPKTVLRSLGMKYWDTFGESYSGGPRWH